MQKDCSTLIDWNDLLLAVARQLQVPLDPTEHSLLLHWEHLIAIAQSASALSFPETDKAKSLNTSRTEVEAKTIASRVLGELKETYPPDTINARFPLSTS